MKIINGKLISEENNQLHQITQRCQILEAEITVISKKDYTFQFKQISQEINNSKTYTQRVNQEVIRMKVSLQKAETKINNLERICQQQSEQLKFIKTAGIITIICLSVLISCSSNNNNKNSRLRTYSQVNQSYLAVVR